MFFFNVQKGFFGQSLIRKNILQKEYFLNEILKFFFNEEKRTFHHISHREN